MDAERLSAIALDEIQLGVIKTKEVKRLFNDGHSLNPDEKTSCS